MYGVGNSIQSFGAEYVGTLVFLDSEWKTGLLPLDQGNLAVVRVHVIVTASVHLYAADATPYLRQHARRVFIIIFVDGSQGYITGDITNTSNKYTCQATRLRAWWLLCSGAFYLYAKRKLSKRFHIYQWDKTFEVYKMLCGWVVKRWHFGSRGCRPVQTLVQAETFSYTFLISQGPHGPCRCFMFWNWESDCTRPCKCVVVFGVGHRRLVKQKPQWEATILLKIMFSETFLFMFSSKCAPEQGLALFQACFCSTERVNVTQCTQIFVLCTLLGPDSENFYPLCTHMIWTKCTETHLAVHIYNTGQCLSSVSVTLSQFCPLWLYL